VAPEDRVTDAQLLKVAVSDSTAYLRLFDDEKAVLTRSLLTVYITHPDVLTDAPGFGLGTA
jgi:hypothetical protein